MTRATSDARASDANALPCPASVSRDARGSPAAGCGGLQAGAGGGHDTSACPRTSDLARLRTLGYNPPNASPGVRSARPHVSPVSAFGPASDAGALNGEPSGRATLTRSQPARSDPCGRAGWHARPRNPVTPTSTARKRAPKKRHGNGAEFKDGRPSNVAECPQRDGCELWTLATGLAGLPWNRTINGMVNKDWRGNTACPAESRTSHNTFYSATTRTMKFKCAWQPVAQSSDSCGHRLSCEIKRHCATSAMAGQLRQTITIFLRAAGKALSAPTSPHRALPTARKTPRHLRLTGRAHVPSGGGRAAHPVSLRSLGESHRGRTLQGLPARRWRTRHHQRQAGKPCRVRQISEAGHSLRE